jgi:hypothetical protein
MRRKKNDLGKIGTQKERERKVTDRKYKRKGNKTKPGNVNGALVGSAWTIRSASKHKVQFSFVGFRKV